MEQKVVVLGLDGTPFTLLRSLADSGVMPRTADLLKQGSFMQMDAPIPEISSVSWSCFMTGKNPAKHGIFGFTDLQPRSYAIHFPNFLDMKSETIMDVIHRHGKRSVVINMPATYPVRKINGILISGFVAIDINKAVYPEHYIPDLKSMDYRLDCDMQLAMQSKDRFMDNIFETLDIREQTLDYFWNNEEWKLFIGVITGTDRLHHFFWDAYENKENVNHENFLRYYSKIDQILDRFYKKLPDDTTFIMLSDHGFTGIMEEVYIANILNELGIMRFRGEEKELENISTDSSAFVLDPGRIYINLKDKYPQGSVEPGNHYEDIREEIIEKLSSYTLPDGVKPITKVVKSEEIYRGDYMPNAPDLILQSKYGYDLKALLNQQTITGRRIFTGMHTQDDAFFFINRTVKETRKPHIMDISPTILSLFGIEKPLDMDGISLI